MLAEGSSPIETDAAPAFAADAAFVIDAAPPVDSPGVARARRAPGPMVLDGDLTEWASARWLAFEPAAAAHRHGYTDGWAPGGTVRFAALYDQEGLLFAFDVDDEDVRSDSLYAENDDGAEIYLDTQPAGGPAYSATSYYLVFTAGGRCEVARGDGDVDLTCHARLREGGFTLEARVTLGFLGGMPGPAARLRFGAGVNDDDGLGWDTVLDGWASWYDAPTDDCESCCPSSGHGEPWCDLSRLGTLVIDP